MSEMSHGILPGRTRVAVAFDLRSLPRSIAPHPRKLNRTPKERAEAAFREHSFSVIRWIWQEQKGYRCLQPSRRA